MPDHSRVTKLAMVAALDLLAKREAVRMSKRKPSTEVDSDILNELEPLSPNQLKTPKSLMCQLSRECPTPCSVRKRLSYSLSVDKSDKLELEELNSDEESDSEVEHSQQGSQQRVPHLNLLNIPLTSPLGQRIKKHIYIDNPVSVVTDAASFCRTPVKNNFLEKLRKKEVSYPVVYKPRRIANLHKEGHLYKFGKAQTREFMRRVGYGLNTRSYTLLRKMKPVKICLKKLSRKTLLKWLPKQRLSDRHMTVKSKDMTTMPGKYMGDSNNRMSEFPLGPSLLAENIDQLLGLKKRSSPFKNLLSISNIVSENMEEEVSKQKLTLYQSLLHEMSVLKPTVIIEDIGDKGSDCSSIGRKMGKHSGERGQKGGKLGSERAARKDNKGQTGTSSGLKSKNVVGPKTGKQINYSVLSSLLRADSENVLVKHDIGRPDTKTQVSSTKLKEQKQTSDSATSLHLPSSGKRAAEERFIKCTEKNSKSSKCCLNGNFDNSTETGKYSVGTVSAETFAEPDTLRPRTRSELSDPGVKSWPPYAGKLNSWKNGRHSENMHSEKVAEDSVDMDFCKPIRTRGYSVSLQRKSGCTQGGAQTEQAGEQKPSRDVHCKRKLSLDGENVTVCKRTRNSSQNSENLTQLATITKSTKSVSVQANVLSDLSCSTKLKAKTDINKMLSVPVKGTEKSAGSRSKVSMVDSQRKVKIHSSSNLEVSKMKKWFSEADSSSKMKTGLSSNSEAVDVKSPGKTKKIHSGTTRHSGLTSVSNMELKNSPKTTGGTDHLHRSVTLPVELTESSDDEFTSEKMLTRNSKKQQGYRTRSKSVSVTYYSK